LAGRTHHSVYYAWTVMRMWQSLHEHCGYNFTWNMFRILPFHLRGDEHDYHHSENVGSYASFFKTWDTVFGTNSSYKKHMANQLENDSKTK